MLANTYHLNGTEPDLRNMRVIDLVNSLNEFGVNASETKSLLGINVVRQAMSNTYDGIVLATRHADFRRNESGSNRTAGQVNPCFRRH